MRQILVLSLLLGLFMNTVPAAPVSACTPTPVPRTPVPTLTGQQRDDATNAEIRDAFARANVVFRARVVSATPQNQNNQMSERAQMIPLVSWKGSAPASVIVYNVRGSSSSTAFTCVPSFFFMPNMEYIVYASARQDGSFDSGNRTRAVGDANADLAVLGPGTAISAAGAGGTTILPTTGMAGSSDVWLWRLGLLTLAGLALTTGIFFRRRGAQRFGP